MVNMIQGVMFFTVIFIISISRFKVIIKIKMKTGSMGQANGYKSLTSLYFDLNTVTKINSAKYFSTLHSSALYNSSHAQDDILICQRAHFLKTLISEKKQQQMFDAEVSYIFLPILLVLGFI